MSKSLANNRPKKPRPPEIIHWQPVMQVLGLTLAPNGDKLAFALQPEGSADFRVQLLVVATPGNSVEGILADHAHELLGTFDGVAEAKRAATKYAVKWLKGYKPEKCACGPIDAEFKSRKQPLQPPYQLKRSSSAAPTSS